MTQQKMNYDFSMCREKFESAPRNDKDYTDAVNYFHERCFYTDKGGVYAYKKGELEYFAVDEFQKTQMIGFAQELTKAIKKKIIPFDDVLETKEFEIDKENRKINSLKPIYASKLKDIKVNKDGLDYVEFFKKYMFEIIANQNEKLNDYVLKWISNVIKMKKNGTSIVIVSSTEGVGKSSLSKIIERLLGKHHATYPSPQSIMRFNMQLYGKLLVVLEETEALQRHEGNINDVLKNLTTNDTFSYESKGIQPRDLPNINNIIMTSNYSLGTAGRRYINITPSTKWLGKAELFDKLFDLDDNKIKALYDYLMSIDTTNFNAEKEGKKLVEESGNLKEIEKMNSAFRFMKDNYALDKINAKIKRVDLFEQYKASGLKNQFNKSSFFERVGELNIELKKTNGDYFYFIDGKKLYDEYKKRNLIDDEADKGKISKVFDNDDALFVDEEKEQLKQENADLKKRLEELEKLLKAQQPKPEIKPVEIKSVETNAPNNFKKVITVKAFTKK